MVVGAVLEGAYGRFVSAVGRSSEYRSSYLFNYLGTSADEGT